MRLLSPLRLALLLDLLRLDLRLSSLPEVSLPRRCRRLSALLLRLLPLRDTRCASDEAREDALLRRRLSVSLSRLLRDRSAPSLESVEVERPLRLRPPSCIQRGVPEKALGAPFGSEEFAKGDAQTRLPETPDGGAATAFAGAAGTGAKPVVARGLGLRPAEGADRGGMAGAAPLAEGAPAFWPWVIHAGRTMWRPRPPAGE